MEAICWCYYWGRISRTCARVETKVWWKFHRWGTSSVMRALWLHPVDAAERTAMMSPKSTYVEATSSRAVLKASLVLYRIYIIILQGYIKYWLHGVYRSLLSGIPMPVLWICVCCCGYHWQFDLPPIVLNPFFFVSLNSHFIHSDSSREEEGGFGVNANAEFTIFFFCSPSQCYFPASTPTRRDI